HHRDRLAHRPLGEARAASELAPVVRPTRAPLLRPGEGRGFALTMTEDTPIQTPIDQLAESSPPSYQRILDPMDRISEILFGLIMVLTYTGSLSVATADRAQTRTMLIGALGCNLAWGIIDAGIYLMARLHERGRKIMLLQAVCDAPYLDAARRIIEDALPPLVTVVLSPEQLELMRQSLRAMPKSTSRFQVTKSDWLGALGVCLLVFLSTFPVAIPFMVTADAKLALRVSNAVAIVMLFLCGYAFGHRSGIRPWATGVVMVAVGIALVAITISLGG